MRLSAALAAALSLGAGLGACSGEDASPPADEALDAGGLARAPLEEGEGDSVGPGTSRVVDGKAFFQPALDLPEEIRTVYFAGLAVFQLQWVATAKGAAVDRLGLGPTFNANACEFCHFTNGRGAAPLDSRTPFLTSLLRVSVPGVDVHGGPLGDPLYGDQIQSLRISADVPSEGDVFLDFERSRGFFSDGEPYELVRPRPRFVPNLGEPYPNLLLSVRVASQTVGLGYLEAISEESIRANADPEDRDGDGVSGRANEVWDVAAKAPRLGRFGWKAGQPTLRQQNAAAFAGDIGITSDLFPAPNCPSSQSQCRALAQTETPEIETRRLDTLTTFVRASSVPARRDANDSEVLRGKWLFRDLRCATCHVPSFETDAHPETPWLSQRKIWPHTDLLLHDMGEGLADGRPEFLATGNEWRTPPLWGLGLIEKVSGHLQLLHDGRARGITEAILWHGGEAAPSRDAFRRASREDRAALLRFLQSL